MKKFLIKVNGNQYEVEVEEIREGASVQQVAFQAPPAQPAAPAASTVENKTAEKTAAKPSISAPAGASLVTAPMPGTILKTNVKVGDTVKQGQVLLVLEAMKMENEITSPSDGKIASVNVAQGDSVSVGDTLVSIS